MDKDPGHEWPFQPKEMGMNSPTDAEKNRFIAETLEPKPKIDYQKSDSIQSVSKAGLHYWYGTKPTNDDLVYRPFHLDPVAMVALIECMNKDGWFVVTSSSSDGHSAEFGENDEDSIVGGSSDGDTLMQAVRDAAYEALKAMEGRRG